MQKIPVVENDRSLKNALRGMLEGEHHLTALTDRVESALKRTSDERSGLILLDLQLPGCAGPELCRELTARRENTADSPERTR